MSKEEKILLDKVACFFEEKIFDKHKLKTSKEHSTLKSYNFNPILVKYLSKILDDKITPVGIAKALYFPRVLGTSINTSFGTNFQNMLVKLELVDGSLHDGMDIEFIDKIDKRKKWCQLKSGPNTINSGDVSPIIDKFSKLANRARQNLIEMNNTTDLIVGVLYGSEDQLSQHYRKINEKHPVYIGSSVPSIQGTNSNPPLTYLTFPSVLMFNSSVFKFSQYPIIYISCPFIVNTIVNETSLQYLLVALF